MKDLKEIREDISKCDERIIEALAERMHHVEEIIEVKKAKGIPIFQPEQEKKQKQALIQKLTEHFFEEEILDIFTYITKNSKKIQAKSLFTQNIMLIGFMGVGKSTVSAYLSKMLALEVVEMDKLIVEKEGMSINDIFQKYGEEYFRNCESNTLIELQSRKQLVVSCGGGVVLREENIKNMKKNGRIVLLTATPETIFNRVKDSTERPILNNNMNVEFIADLMEKRREKYLSAADIIVSTDNKEVQKICEELVGQLTSMS